jgi:hypothetical protein
LEIPPQYQLLSALIIGVLVAIGAAYRFFADLKRLPPHAQPPAPPPLSAGASEAEHIRILGAALGDTVSLAAIADELREIRGVMQRHLDTDRTVELIAAIDRVADAIANRAAAARPPSPPRKRRSRRTAS